MNEKGKQKESPLQDVDHKIEEAFASLVEAVKLLSDEVAEAIKPQRKLYDLKAACEYKGVNYRSVSANRHLQPLAGFSNHTEWSKRYWTDQQVEEWSRVTSEQRPGYYESLLSRPDVSDGVLAELIEQSTAGKLPENIQMILDEYTWNHGRAV